jgi:hypothetical protein
MLKRYIFAAGLVASCVGGTGGGGWEQTGWFGSEEQGVDAGFHFDAAGLPQQPAQGGGSAAPAPPNCGTVNCNGAEVCIGTPDGGPTCTPTCINSLSCDSRCCVLPNGSADMGYCAPKSACCGDTGANCKDGQVCVTPLHDKTQCADKCTSSGDCTQTLCCGKLKDGTGACLYMSQVAGTCM